MTHVPEVNRILVVGAGGFGREVVHWARDAWPAASSRIAGFLAADGGGASPLPVIADPDDFEPSPGDGLLLAIGIPMVRRRVAESLVSRGGKFLTLVHPTAMVAPSASVGAGSILCPYSIASDAVRLGRFTLLNYHASLGHDAATGDFSVLSPYATLGGGACVGADVFLGLHASVAPGKAVGAASKVSANSACHSDVPVNSLVFGVPGQVMQRVATSHGPGDGPEPMTRE